ncbi:diiron oxygenase [Streptomyces prunicolor]|uniref:diiron oxygenase n=1 Tax=Streptomyces prunicolor TaxID=67348 RepID=UPI002257CC11|nr:diiron oxygenase [Streptomyces prunicolor]MCX5239583.1 diiron oxygenase [Streptomyces prunicolor]
MSLADSVAAVAKRLSEVSQHSYQNPYTALDWPETVDPDVDWFSSPELLSLAGTPEWDAMPEAARKRLAFYEAVNFYSLNIHGEKSLMAGLAERLYRKEMIQVADYLHHFLDEENKHSIFFGGFCTRYARVYRSRQFSVNEEEVPRDVGDFLFFAKTMIFEEIVDHYNWLQARDERLHPVARYINRNHHVEEARHLIFGRQLVTELWRTQQWDAQTVDDVRGYLAAFITSSWREYYNPDVYADAGLTDPWEAAETAWQSPAQRKHRRTVTAKCLGFLASEKILPEEPVDAF